MENTYQDVHDEAMADYRRGDFGFADEVPDLYDDSDLDVDDDDGLTDVEADAMTLGENIGYDDRPF